MPLYHIPAKLAVFSVFSMALLTVQCPNITVRQSQSMRFVNCDKISVGKYSLDSSDMLIMLLNTNEAMNYIAIRAYVSSLLYP
jgi:hypothetical protein